MKNLKCIIGATILSPILLGILLTFIAFLVWLDQHFIIARIIFSILVGLGLLIFVIFIWAELYNHCKNYWLNRKSNDPL